MAINTVIHTNQQSIDRVLNTGLPVVLVFWGRNQQLDPQIDAQLNRLAEQYAGKALIAKLNADEEKPVLQRFNVQQAPALLFTKQGKAEANLTGAIQGRDVEAWLGYLVSGGTRPATPVSHVAQGAATNGGSDHPITLTDANFQQVVNGPGPVLVDFWAPWCGPCRTIAPTIEQLAREFKSRAVVGKLNVDENQRTAQQYGIMGIPALKIFKNGKVVDELVGAHPAHVIKQKLAQYAG